MYIFQDFFSQIYKLMQFKKYITSIFKRKYENMTLYEAKHERFLDYNPNTHIEEEQTTQWPKEKEQQDKQRFTKHTYKTKDRITRTSLKTGGELRCSGRASSSFSTSDTRRVHICFV
jgi:hypothetical protein